MVSKFQFFLDGIQVQDPKGWEDLDTTIKRDNALQGVIISQESQPEFYGDGYTLIKNKFDTSGFCEFVEIEIKQTCDQLNYQTIFTGVIFLSDCKFDLMRCSVKVKTVNNGYYAKISNNKNIKADISVGRSKNDVDITAAASHNVAFFVPASGTYGTASIAVYSMYEVFKFLTAFVSDGTIDFVSDDFGVGGQWEGVCITTPHEISFTDQTVVPMVSFQEAFTEINKKLRIGFSIEVINSVPTLRIENLEYFFTQTSIITLPDAKEVTMAMDTSQLFSAVHLGSSTTLDSYPPFGTLSFPELIGFLGFKDETYHVIGTCNVDRTLELSSEWIISSNVIEEIFVNWSFSYDGKVVLVNIDEATNKAVQSNWVDPSTGKYYYNKAFNNESVVSNWFFGIPNQIALFLGDGNDTFRASNTTNNVLVEDNVNYLVMGFDDETNPPNNDPNGNYNPVTAEYTIPQSGIYTFNTSGRMRMRMQSGNTSVLTNFFVRISVYDLFNVLYLSQDIPCYYNGNIENSHTSKSPYYVTFKGNAVFYVPFVGYTVRVEYKIYSSTPSVHNQLINSTYQCTGAINGGGIVGSSDPENYKIKVYSFDYPLTFDQFNTIKADPKKLITFTTNNGVTQTGWIEEIKYYHHNKVASLKLITN